MLIKQFLKFCNRNYPHKIKDLTLCKWKLIFLKKLKMELITWRLKNRRLSRHYILEMNIFLKFPFLCLSVICPRVIKSSDFKNVAKWIPYIGLFHVHLWTVAEQFFLMTIHSTSLQSYETHLFWCKWVKRIL